MNAVDNHLSCDKTVRNLLAQIHAAGYDGERENGIEVTKKAENLQVTFDSADLLLSRDEKKT